VPSACAPTLQRWVGGWGVGRHEKGQGRVPKCQRGPLHACTLVAEVGNGGGREEGHSAGEGR
jgi:hypothetical protein